MLVQQYGAVSQAKEHQHVVRIMQRLLMLCCAVAMYQWWMGHMPNKRLLVLCFYSVVIVNEAYALPTLTHLVLMQCSNGG